MQRNFEFFVFFIFGFDISCHAPSVH
jgi:hypothetical protein